jgi:hypothetical protein
VHKVCFLYKEYQDARSAKHKKYNILILFFSTQLVCNILCLDKHVYLTTYMEATRVDVFMDSDPEAGVETNWHVFVQFFYTV